MSSARIRKDCGIQASDLLFVHHADGANDESAQAPLGSKDVVDARSHPYAGTICRHSSRRSGHGRNRKRCLQSMPTIISARQTVKRRLFVARINSRAQSAPRSDIYERRTYSGRPSSSMRFSVAMAMATSVI